MRDSKTADDICQPLRAAAYFCLMRGIRYADKDTFSERERKLGVKGTEGFGKECRLVEPALAEACRRERHGHQKVGFSHFKRSPVGEVLGEFGMERFGKEC